MREQLLTNEKCESAPSGDDCMRSVTNGNDDVFTMQMHIYAYRYVRGIISNKTGNIKMFNFDVFEKNITPLVSKIAIKV